MIEKIIKNDFRDIYDKAYNEGYEKCFKEYAIWYYCNICGKPIYIKPNSEEHEEIIKHLRNQMWGHKGCHEKRERGEK
ncbi:MAG: hypothetical protein QXU98_07045 [Candidatus Parvarchaeota archaeon]